jgi:hypothetical protein
VNKNDRQRQFIVDDLACEAPDETVERLEKVASERILGRDREVWDVHTDRDRWWVITEPTNLYSQKQFPSLDVALSFHVGVIARVEEPKHAPPRPSKAHAHQDRGGSGSRPESSSTGRVKGRISRPSGCGAVRA